MTSLLLLKVIHMLANFLILWNTLLFKFFAKFWNLDFANEFNNMTSQCRRITSSNHVCHGGGPLKPSSPPPPPPVEKYKGKFDE